MNDLGRRMFWFAVLYAAGVVVFVILTTLVRASLQLLR